MYQGKTITVLRLAQDVAHLRIDQPDASVNTLNRAALLELQQAIAVLEKTKLRGLVCSSAKRGFIAGADISEFIPLFQGPLQALEAWCRTCNAIFTALESLPFPTVSLLSGHALGGGLEFALATDYRLASADAVLGFPEVSLGICPGFGGTVRAPRVMELDAALQWISSGAQYRAAEALAAGALDSITDADLLLEAGIEQIELAHGADADWQALRSRKRAPVLQDREPLVSTIQALSARLVATAPDYASAPVKALQSMTQSLLLPRDGALDVERAVFIELAQAELARNLIGLFTNEQWLRQKSRRFAAQAAEVANAAVLGAGIMGGGIAYQCALKGVPVLMKDIAQAGLDAGMAEADKQLRKLVAKGKLSETKAATALHSIHPSLDYGNFDRVSLVIEAVVENAAVKERVLAEVEGQVADDAIITSNTSTISIASLAKALRHPERFCGMHFFNPVPVMPLVEVIRGPHSSERAIASTVAFAQRLGKIPIVVNDCPGFLVNRILFPYFGAFARLLHDGADYRQIDAAMEAFGWPMGPALLLDVVGIDTSVHAQAVMASGFPERMAYGFKSVMDMLFEAKELGQKTGSGFYRYVRGDDGRVQKQIDDSIIARVQQMQACQREFSAQEIVERMLLPMCLEAVRCLEDDIVESAIEVDMGLILGLGFPRFRGGALRYIDSMGASAFCALADHYAALGPLYAVPQRLRAMAACGQRFYP